MNPMTCDSSTDVGHRRHQQCHQDVASLPLPSSAAAATAALSSVEMTIKRTSSRLAAVAGLNIPAGTRSPDITTRSPLDVSTVFWDESPCHMIQNLQVTLENGCMTSATKKTSWMRHVRLSNNCHTQNVQIAIDHKGILFLEAVRDICAHEPLYAWFSSETSRIFNIPFLSLQNIQGERHYQCHRCSVHYQSPNPLKIHLAFFCPDKVDTSETRFLATHSALPLPSPSNSSSSSAFVAVRPSSSSVLLQESVFLNSHHNPDLPHLHPCLPFVACRQMPFVRPHWPHLHVMGQLHPDHLTQNAHEPQDNFDHGYATAGSSKEPAARNRLNSESVTSMSTIDNGGQHKRRHKCPYCGKLYSRKYGLKIHVRTHTGYKPLKCKVCSRPFGDPSNLNKHVRLHAEGLTPYRCDLCGKVLVRRRDLDRHLKSRHPLRSELHVVSNAATIEECGNPE